MFSFKTCNHAEIAPVEWTWIWILPEIDQTSAWTNCRPCCIPFEVERSLLSVSLNLFVQHCRQPAVYANDRRSATTAAIWTHASTAVNNSASSAHRLASRHASWSSPGCSAAVSRPGALSAAWQWQSETSGCCATTAACWTTAVNSWSLCKHSLTCRYERISYLRHGWGDLYRLWLRVCV